MVELRIDVQHVADAVLYMANLPLGANVRSITVMIIKMHWSRRSARTGKLSLS